MTIRILCMSLLAALPATAYAQSLNDTHEQVSSPGKSTIAYRPLAQSNAPAAKCHPEATKAVACEAQAAIARQEAAALARAPRNEQLSSR